MANIQKTAIVTGGSQGIGAGVVKAFLDRGYYVVANSRNITKANPFPASASLAFVDGDIGEPKTAAKIVDTAVPDTAASMFWSTTREFLSQSLSPNTRPRISMFWSPQRSRAFSTFRS